MSKLKKNGFTLVEIMLVITIIAILFVVLIPRLGFATDKAKEAGVKSDFRVYQTSAESVINEKSFKKMDDGNVNDYLNDYLDKTMYFTDNISAKENPWGYNYRVALNKSVNDEGSGTLEFICIKGYKVNESTRSIDENTDTAYGSKLVITVSEGAIDSKVVEFKDGDSSLIPGDKTPVSIKISKMPKTNFVIGDTFSYTGLEVKVMQADGTSRITSDITITPPSMSIGTHTVSIRLNENASLTTQYTITVKESGSGGEDPGGGENPSQKTLVNIGITNNPSKMSYKTGESFNSSGLAITAYFSDGSSSNVTGSCSFSSVLSKGQTSLTFTYSYSGNTKTVILYGLSVSDSGGEIPSEKVLVSVGISSNPTKLTYKTGESFNIAGMIVTAYFSDSSTLNVTSSCSYNSVLTKGQTSLLFSYTNNGITKSVTLFGLSVTDSGGIIPSDKTLESLSITSYPDKMTYKEGETLNISGLVIKANYSDTTSSIVTSSCAYNSSLILGQTSVIFNYSYNGVTKSVTLGGIVVQSNSSGGGSETKTLNFISLSGSPKTLYNAGQNFSTTGLGVTAHFSDGTTADVSSFVTHDGYNLQPSTIKVNIFYDYNGIRKSAEIAITVKKLLSNITIATMPVKTSGYIEGENVNTSGLQVVANFNDGSTVDVTADVVISNNINLKPGFTTVIVSYTFGDITKQVQFQVFAEKRTEPIPKQLVSISITKMPVKVNYWEEEIFSELGIEVTAVYDDSSKEIVSGYHFTNHTGLTEGTRTITVTYTQGEKTATTTFDITIKKKPTTDYTRIMVSKNASKTTYYRNEVFDSTGMVVQGYFPDELGLSPEVISLSNLKFINTTITTDPHYVVIQYTRGDGKVVSSNYQVHMAGDLESIKITKQPIKVEYLVGEIFDPTGLELTAKFADGLTSIVEPTSYDTDPLKKDQKFITLIYIHNSVVKTIELPITVKSSVSKIEVITPPDKVSYRTGTDFDKTGMVIQATFTDNTTEIVSDKVVVIDGISLKSDQTKVNIKFTWVDKTVTCNQSITVIDTVTKSVAAGNNTSFFIDSKENVYAFGQGSVGQLGTGVNQNEGASRKVLIDSVKQIIPSKEGNFTMFLLGDGTVYGTGDNTNGQLGIGTSSNVHTPTKVKLDGKVKKVVTGANHTLFLMSDNTVYATGLNTSGQLGLSGTDTKRLEPEKLTGLLDIIDIEASTNHSFVITKNGRVYAFGANSSGQLGTNNTATQYNPYPIDNTQMGEVIRVFTSSDHTVFEGKDGRFFVCGANSTGQLALRDNTVRLSPTYSDDITACKPIDIALSTSNTIVVCNDKTIQVAGQNAQGQLMTGNTTAIGSVLKKVTVPDYYEIDFGNYHNICSDKLGEVMTQGTSNNYACGLGDSVARYDWNYIFNAKNMKKVLTGTNQIWIKDSHGTIWVGGKNNYGQLGNGGTTQTGRWLAINDNAILNTKFDSIKEVVIDLQSNAQSNYGTLFILEDGTLWATGTVATGNIGLSGNVIQLTQVGGLSGKVKSVVQYDNYLGVLTESGVMQVSGNVQYLSSSSTGQSNTLTTLSGGIKEFSAFAYTTTSYSNAARVDNSGNLFGSMFATNYPLGGNYNSNTWNYNASQSQVVKTVSGPSFTMILKEDGSVWVAGYNGYGQLGVGTTETQTVFVRALDASYKIKDIVLGGNKYQGTTDYYSSAFAISEIGDVYATGLSSNGQLGLDSTNNVTTFTKVPIVNNITNVYTGRYFTIFKSDTTIWATGVNGNGQLGIGSTTQTIKPQEVLIDATQVKDIKTYLNRTIFEMKDGTIRFCGQSSTGYLGNEWNNNLTVPSELFSYEMSH